MARNYLPIVPRAEPYGSPTRETGYDEVIFDYETNSYKTRSQQIEIMKLKDELKEKQAKRKRDLKSIIGYYYKR